MKKLLDGLDEKTRSSLRPDSEVMNPRRLEAFRLTSLSISRIIIRKMTRESWNIKRTVFDLDSEGYGKAIYRINTPQGLFHFIIFSQKMSDEKRDDSPSSMEWDITFTLYEGEITKEKVSSLETELPKQKLGRGDKNCLIWSRANKSERVFQYIVDKLSLGEQPDIKTLAEVGYIFRTTAVFGNGKFGIAPLENMKKDHTFYGAFHAEIFSVYLIRQFSFELVEHIAKKHNPNAPKLNPAIKEYLGVGNSTGFGMLFFVCNHPKLIHRWVIIREIALARSKQVKASEYDYEQLIKLLERCKTYFNQSPVGNETHALISSKQLAIECDYVKSVVLECYKTDVQNNKPWIWLTNKIKQNTQIETQELLNSLLIELYPDLIQDLEKYTVVEENYNIVPEMDLKDLKSLINKQYYWAFQFDFNLEENNYYTWYQKFDRDLPRAATPGEDKGIDKYLPFDIARQVQKLASILKTENDYEKTASFLLRHPEFKYIVRRIQSLDGHYYGEVHSNLISKEVKPIQLERLKLSILGAEQFSPISNFGVRVTFFQGAPLIEDIETTFHDNWIFKELPKIV